MSGAWRAALRLGPGILALAVLWAGPLPALAQHSFAAHMAMHMGVVAVAAPLLALGLARGPWDPVPRLPRLFPPVPASMLEFAVVWGWHLPGLHHAARHTASGILAEQALFFGAAFWVWISSFGGRPGGNRAGAGVAALLLTFMHVVLLGALLALAPRPLYGERSPLEDLHLGGVIMLAGGTAYLAGGIALAATLLREWRQWR